MTAGPVNRALLESFYQNPGEIYDDTKTEGALDVIADQIDENWVPVGNITGPNGDQYVGATPITGVTGANVYLQLLSLKQQIDAIVGSNIPPGTITYSMLAPTPTEVPTASTLPLYDANSRLQTADPVSGLDVVNKQTFDTVAINNIRMISGTYTGDGTASRNISITVTPKFMYITGFTDGNNNVSSFALNGSPSATTVGYAGASQIVATTTVPSLAIPTIISGGFTVTGTTGNGLNVNTRVYTYAVFY